MNETLANGLAVMFIGIGAVLAFLCITILAMYIMSWVVGKLNEIFPEAIPQVAGAKKAVSSNDDENIAVAILTAMLKSGRK